MEKLKNISLWVEEGYSLFAHEGLSGLQVERLSRIVNLNKSSFYHYFGDMEIYCAEIIKLHEKKLENFLNDISRVKNFDPDYLHLLIKHGRLVMFQVHLTHAQSHPNLFRASEIANQKLIGVIQPLWSDYLGIDRNPELAIRYFNIVRDKFNTRVSFENLNYPFLHNLASEVKQIFAQLTQPITVGRYP